jgi:hypothetical protein
LISPKDFIKIFYFAERLHSIGNLRLSRIQKRLEKDPSFYSKVHHGRESGPLTNTTLSWMRDLFSKHGECMSDRDTIHIPDNFSRRKIYNLYKEYAEGVEGNYYICIFYKNMEETIQQCPYS